MFSRRSPATSPRHLSPNPASSPSHVRSRSTSLPSSSCYTHAYTPPPSRPVQSEEALRTVRVLEGVLVAWNEYRLAVSQEGRAARRLASAIRDLSSRTDREGVAYNALKPTSQSLDALADSTIAHSKRLEGTYDQANSEASRYFQNLAREVRDHGAYLSNEGKRAERSEKAYRKASKVMTEGAIQGSGLEAMKDALRIEVETASENHTNLLGDAQAAIIFKVSAGLAGIIHPTVAFHSEGLKIATERLGEIEYFRALSAVQWQDLSRPEVYHAPAGIPVPSKESVNVARGVSEKSHEAISGTRATSTHVTPASADTRNPPLLRPRLPASISPTSSQSNTPPAMRSRNSLPPPPMYASSTSIATMRQLASPTPSSATITLPQSYTQPLRIPDRTPRRRVSDIVALHESVLASSSSVPPPTARRISMPPPSGNTPGGPRPRPSRSSTAIVPQAIQPISPDTNNPGWASSSSSSRQSSSILTSDLLSPSSSTTGDSGVLKSALKRRPVSFGGAVKGDKLESFPWGMRMSGDEAQEAWGDVSAKGVAMEVGVLQPSPRRVASLSPELREMMSG